MAGNRCFGALYHLLLLWHLAQAYKGKFWTCSHHIVLQLRPAIFLSDSDSYSELSDSKLSEKQLVSPHSIMVSSRSHITVHIQRSFFELLCIGSASCSMLCLYNGHIIHSCTFRGIPSASFSAASYNAEMSISSRLLPFPCSRAAIAEMKTSFSACSRRLIMQHCTVP